MDRDEVKVHKRAKKEQGQYLDILTEQAWSIKDLLHELKHQNMINFPCGTKPASQAGKIAPSGHQAKATENTKHFEPKQHFKSHVQCSPEVKRHIKGFSISNKILVEIYLIYTVPGICFPCH